MIRWAMIAGLALTAAFAATAAPARLVVQRTEGVHRQCIYEQPLSPRPRDRRFVARRVGMGEPCPRRDPGPELRRAPVIPSTAIRIGEQLVRDQRVCFYSAAGVRYSRAIPRTRSCPLTPHFID